MGEVIHVPLKEIDDADRLEELFWALPEKNIERLIIIKRLQEAAGNGNGNGRAASRRVLESLDAEKQVEAITASLQVPWGDWSRIYRVRGLFSAIRYIESSSGYFKKNPSTIYNLSFLYYIAYSFIRDDAGKRRRKYREKALALASEAAEIYKSSHSTRLDRYVAVFGGYVRPEWRKNLSEYCASLACNVAALVHLLDNELEEALGVINDAFETHPTPPEVYFSMGVLFLKNNAFNPAIRMLKESLKRKGEHLSEAKYQLGRAYYAKSLYLIRQAEELGDHRGKEKKRMLRLADERIEKSMEAFQESVTEDPYFSLPYYWMGMVYLLRRDCSCDKATGMIDLALDMDPHTIRRYLQAHPLSCRSPNDSCKRFKLREYVTAVVGGGEQPSAEGAAEG